MPRSKDNAWKWNRAGTQLKITSTCDIFLNYVLCRKKVNDLLCGVIHYKDLLPKNKHCERKVRTGPNVKKEKKIPIEVYDIVQDKRTSKQVEFVSMNKCECAIIQTRRYRSFEIFELTKWTQKLVFLKPLLVVWLQTGSRANKIESAIARSGYQYLWK